MRLATALASLLTLFLLAGCGGGGGRDDAPTDPDSAMSRSERRASEAADYRASFRRQIARTPVDCRGENTSIADSLQDTVGDPTQSASYSATATTANDIELVTVQIQRRWICVTLTFRAEPAAPLRVTFTPRSRRALFPQYVVEIDPKRGVRGGALTGSYRYFRQGCKLNAHAVPEISLYGHAVAFVADTRSARLPLQRVPADLTWTVSSTAATGSDQVPNQAVGHDVVIRQSNGRPVTA
jgi:hypothetical protein